MFFFVAPLPRSEQLARSALFRTHSHAKATVQGTWGNGERRFSTVNGEGGGLPKAGFAHHAQATQGEVGVQNIRVSVWALDITAKQAISI